MMTDHRRGTAVGGPKTIDGRQGPASLGLWAVLILPVLLGCSLLQGLPFVSGPAAAPTGSPTPGETLPAAQTASETPTRTATQTASPSAPPTLTLTPSPTLLPSFTPLPSATPGKLPTFIVRLPPTPTSWPCCTLRVTNAGRRTYWIGTHPPTLGNWIKPDQYIEFYYPEPTSIRVYWCRYRPGANTVEAMFDCQNRLVTALDGLTRIEVK